MSEEQAKADFEAAVESRGAAYRAVRDRILDRKGAERDTIRAVLDSATAGAADWNRSLTGEILASWLTDRETVRTCDRYAAGDIPRPAPMAGFTTSVRAESIGEIGRGAVPRVLERLWKSGEHEDPDERSALFASLPKLGDLRAVPPMIALVEDAQAGVGIRGSAAGVLSRLGDPRGVDPVLGLAGDPSVDPSLRLTAIRCLGRFQESSASAALVSILTRHGTPVEERRAAADGLAWARDPGTGEAIAKQLLAEEDRMVRLTLVMTLGEVGTEAEVATLEAAASDWPDLKARIDKAIEEIRER